MTITKDNNYWKQYNQKRKAYIQQKNKERYLARINTTEQNNTTIRKLIQPIPPLINTTIKINTTGLIQPIERIQPSPVYNENSALRIQPSENLKHTTGPEEMNEITLYNELVYQRAGMKYLNLIKVSGTKDPNRFFTFADGRKIVRTKCGCNKLEESFGWCLDTCAYLLIGENKVLII